MSELISDLLDTVISDLGISSNSVTEFQSGNSESTSGVSWHEPDYEGSIDYRIRQLSYSSLLTLHSCPRKFQLAKLRTTHRTEELLKSSITFSFGHVVGEGIASLLSGESLSAVYFKMFYGWHTNSIFDEDEKLKKSLWSAFIAVRRFADLSPIIFKDYELVWYEDKPAVELSFCINFPDGFRLRGFVDAVLRHKITGKIVVLECKTTGYQTINPATYKNSAQAIGYSIVLDHLFPTLSSYSVIYLVYSTTQGEYTVINFDKTYLQRALWIRTLLLDIEMIKMYEETQIYPQHGESCIAFGRDCEYLNSCMLSTEYLTKPCTEEQRDKTEYQITVSLADLLESQLSKIATTSSEPHPL